MTQHVAHRASDEMHELRRALEQEKAEVARLTRENLEKDDESLRLLDVIGRQGRDIDGWKRTALAMRDAAILWERDGKNRCDAIQAMYFDAAMGIKFFEEVKP